MPRRFRLINQEGPIFYRRPGEFTVDLILPAREKEALNRIFLLLQQEKDVDLSRFSEGEVLRWIRR